MNTVKIYNTTVLTDSKQKPNGGKRTGPPAQRTGNPPSIVAGRTWPFIRNRLGASLEIGASL
jgi:hypothetical protein